MMYLLYTEEERVDKIGTERHILLKITALLGKAEIKLG